MGDWTLEVASVPHAVSPISAMRNHRRATLTLVFTVLFTLGAGFFALNPEVFKECSFQRWKTLMEAKRLSGITVIRPGRGSVKASPAEVA